jgi:hypothetical protein
LFLLPRSFPPVPSLVVPFPVPWICLVHHGQSDKTEGSKISQEIPLGISPC